MVIFHSYVSLPEGINCFTNPCTIVISPINYRVHQVQRASTTTTPTTAPPVFCFWYVSRSWKNVVPCCPPRFRRKYICFLCIGWLVAWNICYFSIYCNNPNWLIFFKMVQTTNQSIYRSTIVWLSSGSSSSISAGIRRNPSESVVQDELQEIILYLRDPDRFTRLGAKLPKGPGPPGRPPGGSLVLAERLNLVNSMVDGGYTLW